MSASRRIQRSGSGPGLLLLLAATSIAAAAPLVAQDRLNVMSRAVVGVRAGSTYRVCAVVPELGDRGKACTEPVTLR